MTNQQLSNEIQRLQAIQRSQPNSHTDAWELASELLQPLFAEAAKRQAAACADGIESL